MSVMNKIKKRLTVKSAFFLGFVVCFAAVGIFYYTTRVFGEQSGSSPDSGATSWMKTASDELAVLGYGSTAMGPWGNWGAMFNRIASAAATPFNDALVDGIKNGTGFGSANCTDTFALNCYTKAVGGVDSYNNNNPIPSDAYQATWITCNSGNNYCDTGRSVAEAKDTNTGLVWSPRISTSSNWFTANNCQYPNGLPGDDGTCNTNGEVACYCVKRTSSKTGCEGYDDGNWRLPYQMELMQSYIDGARGNLTNPATLYWSSTTYSNFTQYAWGTYQYNGYTDGYGKTSTYSVRCVR